MPVSMLVLNSLGDSLTTSLEVSQARTAAPILLRPVAWCERQLLRVPRGLWSALVTITYVCVISVVLLHHVLWRDEAQMWLVTRASGSLGALWENLEYENRPILWFLVIWPFSRLSANPEWIKLPTLFASMAVSVMVTRFLPLARIEQLALLSGFIFLLGYSTTSTGYMLGVACLLMWAVAYSRKNLALQYVAILLAASDHFLFLLAAAPLWVMSSVVFLRTWSVIDRSRRLLISVASVIAALGFILSAWMIKPPADYGYAWTAPAAVDPPLMEFVDYLSSGIRGPGLAIPRVLAFVPAETWFLLLLIVCLCALLLVRSRALAPVAGILLIGLNGIYGYGPYWWHSGVVVVLIVLVLTVTRLSTQRSWVRGILLVQSFCFALILITQIWAGVSVPGRLMWGTVPYSGSLQAAEVVRSNCKDCRLVTDSDLMITGVSAYLGGAAFDGLNVDRKGTFTIWDKASGAQPPATWEKVRRSLNISPSSSVAVLASLRQPPGDFEVLGLTGPSVQTEEQFLIVRLKS